MPFAETVLFSSGNAYLHSGLYLGQIIPGKQVGVQNQNYSVRDIIFSESRNNR